MFKLMALLLRQFYLHTGQWSDVLCVKSSHCVWSEVYELHSVGVLLNSSQVSWYINNKLQSVHITIIKCVCFLFFSFFLEVLKDKGYFLNALLS